MTTGDPAPAPESAGPAPVIRPLAGWLAIALVFGTSAAVLVLEILAGRLLAPYVGVSLDTFTGIIGTILAGIAFGAWAGGRAADLVDPRRLIPPLLVAGGALAIATIPVVRVLGDSSGSGGGARILVLTAIGFLPSATVLSAVPPAVVKLQLLDLDTTGATVGRLSAWGTAGALFGTFSTGYVLVAAAAVTTLIVGVGVALIASGLVLWIVDRRARIVPGPNRAPRSTGSDPETTAMLSLVGVAALSLVGVAAIESPCERRTAYYCLSVVEDPDLATGRTLLLDDLRHSYVDLDDPTRLEFWYIRRLVDAIEVHEPSGGAIDVVFLGGGAFTIPRYVRETRPGSDQAILEIDPDLVDVVTGELGFEKGPDVEIVVGDGRLELRDVPDDSADVAIGDAFGSRSVPYHLATEEFLDDVARVLRPDGIYAANVIDGPAEEFLRAEAATIAEVWDHVAVIRGPGIVNGLNGNSVIVASDEPLDLDGLGAALADDREPSETDFERIERLGSAGPGPGELVAGDDLGPYLDGATVLTDDFAPVDQLISR